MCGSMCTDRRMDTHTHTILSSSWHMCEVTGQLMGRILLL